MLLASGGQASWSIDYRDRLAAARWMRGSLQNQKGELAAAIADCDIALQLREGVRDALLAAGGDDAWGIFYRDGLAGAHLSRADARADADDVAGAMADYNAAIGLQKVSAMS